MRKESGLIGLPKFKKNKNKLQNKKIKTKFRKSKNQQNGHYYDKNSCNGKIYSNEFNEIKKKDKQKLALFDKHIEEKKGFKKLKIKKIFLIKLKEPMEEKV